MLLVVAVARSTSASTSRQPSSADRKCTLSSRSAGLALIALALLAFLGYVGSSSDAGGTLLQQGKGVREVAGLLGIAPTSVCRWKAALAA